MLIQAIQNDAIQSFTLQLAHLLDLLGTPPVLSRVSKPVAASLKPASSSKIRNARITGRSFANACC